MSGKSSASSGFKNNAYYESDRNLQQLTHADFAKDADFESIDYSEELTSYLLSKDYDKFFTVKRNNQVTADTSIINSIFYECFSLYKDKIDTVLIFHIITDFYDIDPKHMFEKLVRKIRMILIRDLKRRMDIPSTGKTKLSKSSIQHSFDIKTTDSIL